MQSDVMILRNKSPRPTALLSRFYGIVGWPQINTSIYHIYWLFWQAIVLAHY